MDSNKYETEANNLRKSIQNVEAEYEREALKYRAQYNMLVRKDKESVDIISKQNARLKELTVFFCYI